MFVLSIKYVRKNFGELSQTGDLQSSKAQRSRPSERLL